MSAVVRERRYSSGRLFATVECVECGVVLNSGHHYQIPGQGRLAADLAYEHNVSHHGGEVASCL